MTQFFQLDPPTVPTSSYLILKIDADVDLIYAAVQGNRGPEYTLAEADAKAYALAGYTGSVPLSVSAWATAKGQTAQWSADSILATAAQWRYAMGLIRAQRLTHKEQARAPGADLQAVQASWNGFVVTVRGQLGVA